MKDPAHPNRVSLATVPLRHSIQGERFESDRRSLSRAAGGRALGCSHMRVPPGKSAWPRHFHLANEEAVYVLSGSGTARVGDDVLPLRPGDYLALPAGAGHAHRIDNDGAEPLEYLIFSTMNDPDVMVYPDSNKLAVFAGSPPGGDASARHFETVLDLAAQREYWNGE